MKHGKNNINITVIGNGSNILVKDNGIRGIVIKIDLNYIEDRLSMKIKQTTLYNAEPQGLYLVEVFYD